MISLLVTPHYNFCRLARTHDLLEQQRVLDNTGVWLHVVNGKVPVDQAFEVSTPLQQETPLLQSGTRNPHDQGNTDLSPLVS